MFDDLDAHRKEMKRQKKPPCDKLHMCVCARGAHEHTMKMAQHIDKAIKGFAKEGQNKGLLLAGRVCTVFIGRPPAPADSLSTAFGDGVVSIWSVIGWQWQRPWRSLFHQCDRRGCLVGTEIVDMMCSSHCLSSALQVCTTHKMCAGFFGKHLRWDVGFFVLTADGTLCGDFVLGEVAASPSSFRERLCLVWDPLAKRRAPSARGWQFALDALGDAPSDSSDNQHMLGDEDGAHLEDEVKFDFGDGLDGALLEEEEDDEEQEGATPMQEGGDDADDEGGGALHAEPELDAIFGPWPAAELAPPEPSGVGPEGGDDAPPAPAVAIPAPARQSKATAEVFFHGHRVAYYQGRQEFYAICSNERHGKLCRKARSARPSSDLIRRSAQGRPLGYLAAWLLAPTRSPCVSADEHKWLAPCNHQQRVAAREALKQCDGADVLFAYERPLRPGEPEEPDDEA